MSARGYYVAITGTFTHDIYHYTYREKCIRTASILCENQCSYALYIPFFTPLFEGPLLAGKCQPKRRKIVCASTTTFFKVKPAG